MAKKFRLVIWNCAQGLQKKYTLLQDLKPDIAIVPECADQATLLKKAPDFAFGNMLWTGLNKNKGLGVFSFGETKIESVAIKDNQGYLFLPVKVIGTINLNLLAVWAFNHRNPLPESSSVTTAHVITKYQNFLGASTSIVAGDFNHNPIWDDQIPRHKFRDTLKVLRELEMTSAYHDSTKEEFGKETAATFYWQRKLHQPYHIDYAFLSKNFQTSNQEFKIGSPDKYLSQSDHMPICLDIY
jgi:hypothetical protein